MIFRFSSQNKMPVGSPEDLFRDELSWLRCLLLMKFTTGERRHRYLGWDRAYFLMSVANQHLAGHTGLQSSFVWRTVFFFKSGLVASM